MASQRELGHCDDKTQDLLHKLELENLSYHEKANVAKELVIIRKERRIAKDQIDLLTPIMMFMDGNKKFLDQLTQLLGLTLTHILQRK